MPAAIQFECEVSERAIRDFVDALTEFQKKTGRDLRGALRSAAIDLVKSLRARTRKSKKIVDRSDVSKSYLQPKWIFRGNSGKPLRRMQIIRWSDGSNYLVHRYVYGGEYVAGPRGGLRIRQYTDAHMRKEAREVYGKIRNWGLAKKSWGWFMKSLFKKSMQDENPKAVLNSRMVDGGILETHEVLPDGTVDRTAPVRCVIDIINKLEYIRDAMPPGVIATAVQKATNLITKKAQAGYRSAKFGR
jgi:hypothetical protein